MLRIRLLGQLSLALDSRPVPGPATGRLSCLSPSAATAWPRCRRTVPMSPARLNQNIKPSWNTWSDGPPVGGCAGGPSQEHAPEALRYDDAHPSLPRRPPAGPAGVRPAARTPGVCAGRGAAVADAAAPSRHRLARLRDGRDRARPAADARHPPADAARLAHILAQPRRLGARRPACAGRCPRGSRRGSCAGRGPIASPRDRSSATATNTRSCCRSS